MEMLAFRTLLNRPSLQLQPLPLRLPPLPVSNGLHPRLGLSSFQLDVRDEGREEELGSRRDGFTPLIRRRKRLNEGFEQEGWRDGGAGGGT